MSSNDCSRLVLGTVQLGLQYGIANKSGKPDQKLADEIISRVWESGGREFDTAQGYGDSEAILGSCIRKYDLGREARIITKPFPDAKLVEKEFMEKSILGSVERLGVERIHGVMLHEEGQLNLWDKGLGASLLHVRDKGLAEHIGVSVYSPEKAHEALDTDGIDLVQLPANIFDCRFEQAGVFEKAEQLGKKIYIRSLFLQGLFFMSPNCLPEGLEFAAPYLKELNDIVEERGYSIHDFAKQYVMQTYPQAKIIVGAELPEQVTENFCATHKEIPDKILDLLKDTYNSVPQKLVNPAMWKT